MENDEVNECGPSRGPPPGVRRLVDYARSMHGGHDDHERKSPPLVSGKGQSPRQWCMNPGRADRASPYDRTSGGSFDRGSSIFATGSSQSLSSPMYTPSPPANLPMPPSPPIKSPEKGRRPSVGGMRRKLYQTVQQAEVLEESLQEDPVDYYKRLETEQKDEEVSPISPLPPADWTSTPKGSLPSPRSSPPIFPLGTRFFGTLGNVECD